jgi:hypothetical protein
LHGKENEKNAITTGQSRNNYAKYITLSGSDKYGCQGNLYYHVNCINCSGCLAMHVTNRRLHFGEM